MLKIELTEGMDWIHQAQTGFCIQDNEPPNSTKGKEFRNQIFTLWSKGASWLKR
jgi:hypothetical protein